MNATTTRPRATAKYKALIAAGLSDDDALGVLGVPTPAADDRMAGLVAAGFTETQARKIIGEPKAEKTKGKKKGKGKKPKVTAKIKAEAAEVLARSMSPKERADALVADTSMTFARGRVYGQAALAEALLRVLETGTPEIVKSSGAGRVAGVLVYKEESGDVAMQNLTNSKPA